MKVDRVSFQSLQTTSTCRQIVILSVHKTYGHAGRYMNSVPLYRIRCIPPPLPQVTGNVKLILVRLVIIIVWIIIFTRNIRIHAPQIPFYRIRHLVIYKRSLLIVISVFKEHFSIGRNSLFEAVASISSVSSVNQCLRLRHVGLDLANLFLFNVITLALIAIAKRYLGYLICIFSILSLIHIWRCRRRG